MNTQQFVKVNPRIKYILTSNQVCTATAVGNQPFLGPGMGSNINLAFGYVDLGHLGIGDIVKFRSLIEVSAATVAGNNVAVFVGINGQPAPTVGMQPILTSTSPNPSYMSIDTELFIASPTLVVASGTNFVYPSSPVTSFNMLTAQAFPVVNQTTLFTPITSNNFASVTVKFNAVDATLTATNLFTTIQVIKF